MYKVLIRPVLTYASETWILSKTNERQPGLSREGYFGVSSEQSRRMGHGEKDTTMNYMNCLMTQILLITLKPRD